MLSNLCRQDICSLTPRCKTSNFTASSPFSANISATEIRRQKLSYQDLATYTAEAAQAWDDLIGHKNNEKIDRQYLLELVRGGVPRARRGEVWQFLIKQNQFRKPDTSDKQCWKETPYRTLLKRNSGHQHAILIDLGKNLVLIRLLSSFHEYSCCYLYLHSL